MKMLTTEVISFKDALKLENTIFVDTRTSNEFENGHINNSINIPIFDNEERAEIGYVYKQISKEDATELGLETASIKLPKFYSKLKEYKDKKIIIYCARGGMRSKTISITMSLMGLDVYQLEGGFKSYRNFILNYFDKYNPKFNVLSGNTGSGKTLVLKELIKKDIPVIDLEGMANHRGSIFGDIGLGATETQKNFEAKLFDKLYKYENTKVFIESESRKIGNIIIPENIHKGIVEGNIINIISAIKVRVKRIEEEYINSNFKEEFVPRLEKIKRFMSNEDYETIKKNILEDKLAIAIEIILINYYDVLYNKWHEQEGKNVIISSDDMGKCVESLAKMYKK